MINVIYGCNQLHTYVGLWSIDIDDGVIGPIKRFNKKEAEKIHAMSDPQKKAYLKLVYNVNVTRMNPVNITEIDWDKALHD
jgi:hypothetical protein